MSDEILTAKIQEEEHISNMQSAELVLLRGKQIAVKAKTNNRLGQGCAVITVNISFAQGFSSQPQAFCGVMSEHV